MKNDTRNVTNYAYVKDGVVYMTNGHYAVSYNTDLEDGVYDSNLEKINHEQYGIDLDRYVNMIKQSLKETDHLDECKIEAPIPFKAIDMNKNGVKVYEQDDQYVWINKDYYKTLIDAFDNPVIISKMSNMNDGQPQGIHIKDDNGNRAVIMAIRM